MIKFIDTHVHIDFYDDPISILNEYEKLEIYAIAVTNLPKLFIRMSGMVKNYKYIRLALGHHPDLIGEYDFNKNKFSELLPLTKYVGEVGLDFHQKVSSIQDKQIKAFEAIVYASRNKILTIHARKAEHITLSILQNMNIKFAIFHWYTGPPKLIDAIAAQGYFFSVNPRMLTSENGLRIIKRIPPNRMLFETDGPFVLRSKKIVVPKDIKFYYDLLANFLNEHNIKEIIFDNFRKLLREHRSYIQL